MALLLLTAACLSVALLLWWLRRPVASCPAQPDVRLLERGLAERVAEAVPQRLWSYWHQGEPPLVVRRCLENWRRHCPGWQIELITGRTIGQFIDPATMPAGFERLTPARQSDWLRLSLLARHGGVWIDASTILTTSLDWLVVAQAQSGAQYLGFYLQRYTQREGSPIVDSWCMASPPGTRFVTAWRDELCHALALGDDAYLEELKRAGRFERLRQGIADPSYLIIHMCAQAVLERGAGYRLQLWRAEDTAYFLQHLSHWRRLRLYRRLLWHPAPERAPPLIKLRGGERRKLEPYLRRGLYRRDSIVGMQLSGGAGAP
jgi:hypothetical protein